MMKYILGFIAVVIITLGLYVYMDKSNKDTAYKSAVKVVKKITPTHKIENSSACQEQARSATSSTVNMEKKNLKDEITSLEQKTKVSSSVEEEGEIGKGITLESIENADVSDEEKKRMIDNMLYYQGLNIKYESLSEEDHAKMILEDLKKYENE